MDEDYLLQDASKLDPGIFAVEGFLTEEEEAEILSNLGGVTR